MRDRARAVRAQYVAMETERYGRSWTREEIMLGFLGDVGDLASSSRARRGCGRATTWTRHWPTSWPTACGR